MADKDLMMAHVVMWGGWYGSHNVGDQVLLLTITDLLHKEIGNVHFSVLTADPGHLMDYMSKESTCQVDAIRTKKEIFKLIRTLATCDLFVFGGGVPFFGQLKQVLTMAFLTGVVRLFRRPYLLWCVSSLPVTSRFAKNVFRWVVTGASAVTYRDQYTLNLFEDSGVKREMLLVPDSGFCMANADDSVAFEVLSRAGWQDNGRKLIALTPRTLRSADGEAETHYVPKTNAEYDREIDCFAAVLDWLWENGYQPLFVPMNTVFPDDDRVVSKLVINRARHGKNALLVDEEVRPHVVPAVYRQCYASFVSRVHGSITAAVGLSPMMVYAFEKKHAGAMESMGMEAFILFAETASSERAVALIQDLVTRREQVRKDLQAKLEMLCREAVIPAQLAKKIIEGDRARR